MSNVLVLCARRYNGHELWTTLGVMQNRGHTFEVVSTDYVIQDELSAGTPERTKGTVSKIPPHRIKRIIDDVQPEEIDVKFNGLMIVSGNMDDTESYWYNKHVLKLVDTAESLGKPIAAICCSVPTVRNAARDKAVSFFPLVRSRDLLLRAGAKLTTVAVSRDKNLVTAEHQMATQMWAEEFCNLLEGKQQQYFFQDSGYVPHGHQRKPIPIIEDLRSKLNNGEEAVKEL